VAVWPTLQWYHSIVSCSGKSTVENFRNTEKEKEEARLEGKEQKKVNNIRKKHREKGKGGSDRKRKEGNRQEVFEGQYEGE
jgi:hypothetical protein